MTPISNAVTLAILKTSRQNAHHNNTTNLPANCATLIMNIPLLTVPNEILFHIAENLSPKCVAALHLSCRTFAHPLRAFLLSQYKNDILIFAARNNHLDQLKVALSAGADIHHYGLEHCGRETQALTRAAAGGHTAIIAELLRYHPALEDSGKRNPAIDDDYGTPLLEAVVGGHQTAVDLLLAAGADPTVTRFQDSLLYLAIFQDLETTAIAYIDQMDESSFLLAIKCRRLKITRLMFERGIAATVTPPITHAVHSGIPFVQLCLEFGADINAVGVLGMEFFQVYQQATTALTVAARRGDIPMMTFLLDQGADPDAGLPMRRPIVAAASSGRIDAFRFLLQHGVDMVGLQDYTTDLLEIGCTHGDAELVALMIDTLVERNVGFSAVSLIDESGLIYLATREGKIDILRMLLKRGGEVDGMIHGETALQCAARYGCVELAQLLIVGGASICKLDRKWKKDLTRSMRRQAEYGLRAVYREKCLW